MAVREPKFALVVLPRLGKNRIDCPMPSKQKLDYSSSEIQTTLESNNPDEELHHQSQEDDPVDNLPEVNLEYLFSVMLYLHRFVMIIPFSIYYTHLSNSCNRFRIVVSSVFIISYFSS